MKPYVGLRAGGHPLVARYAYEMACLRDILHYKDGALPAAFPEGWDACRACA